MPEQQKIDETIESTKRFNKKKLSDIEQSSTSLESQGSESEMDLIEDLTPILETQEDETKS
ncbi:hypothetical protein [Candidatus Nitrosocosmicus sp. SS]|jgi:hypothetical protein|uniref:hypothetical protein n=1 Tax=Candidatus Nitrosocosmicus agrestis TaxID=2563600 RepID=UPI00122E7B6C|nr:hypothetical protein [Candidatus Nitrosocosmicus sp. SS]KAA2283149.1 hypothetical protein F1Z66_03460 [Candidatus Nitrosocosmicus sp. SS]KAF0868605.1 hypothetical protein E5N71_09490 [Candidatus Nitrosocosmicus sp. SS]